MKRVVAYRLLVLTVFGFWLGGLTFYAAVVIPTAHRVLRSHLRVGYITQQVTGWINVAALVALFALLVSMFIERRVASRGHRLTLTGTWLLMLAAQIGLFVLHPMLDRLLASGGGFEIIDETRFYNLHRAYLLTTMLQQAAGLVHLFALLSAWRTADAGHG